MKKLIISAISISYLFLNAASADEGMASTQAATPPPTAEAPTQMLGKVPALESTVGQYVTAWQQKNFKTMLSYEDWEGGSALDETSYIQSFDANFRIGEWKITKVEGLEENQYKVLVLISHTPPTEVAALLPEGKMVRSTLVQFWKKQGEKFVHQYHVEKELIWNRYQPQLPPQLPPEQPK